MNQTKINIRLKSSNLPQTISAVKEMVEREFTDEKWDVTVDIDYEIAAMSESSASSNRTESGQDTAPNSESVSSSNEKDDKKEIACGKKNVRNPLRKFRRVYTSHDFDLQTDLSGIVPNPSIPAPWEPLDNQENKRSV